MNASVAKKTQDALGKVIKKPQLTEKLLSKPPFRYLHDIFSEVIRTTGFMKGLYSETEMKADNVKDKDSKVAFLQKAIDVVMLVSGEPLSVKPMRIVAGHEPERTNELLQAIAKCCINKLSSEEAVKRVLGRDKADSKGKASTSRLQNKENREGREREPRESHKVREDRKREEISQETPKESKSGKEEQDKSRSGKDRRRHSDRPDKAQSHEGDSHRTKDDRDKGKSRDRERDREKDRERDGEKGREKDREKDKDRGKERDKGDRDREKAKDKESHRDKERDRERDRDRDRDRERRKDRDWDKNSEKDKDRHGDGDRAEKGDKKVRVTEPPKPHPEEPSNTTCPEPTPTEVTDIQPESPARIPRPSSAKGQRRRPKARGADESDSEDGDAPLAERPVVLENGDATDTASVAHSNSRPVRPSSARPAPPRAKTRLSENSEDVAPTERLGSAKMPAAVIMDRKKQSSDEDDDDEQFMVEEVAPPPTDVPDMVAESTVELEGDEKHGGLVKKILETKKDFESSPSSPKSRDQTQNLLSDAARRKERDVVSREMERLRSSIQTVCRSALPLGKIMDYIQEDMDAMQNELNHWRRENKEHALALQEEQRITDSVMEPLKAELLELEQQIRDQQDKICAVKANKLKNEENIQKMVNFSSL